MSNIIESELDKLSLSVTSVMNCI